MPRGFGRGFGFRRGFGGSPYGYGRGRRSPFPFSRNFAWLPRWSWVTPNAGPYAATIPYSQGYDYPYNHPGYMPPYAYPGYGVGYPGTTPPGTPAG